PLSFAQERLWFLDQLEPGNVAYNIPVAVRLQGRLDIAALEHSLSAIVQRHEILRTTFALHEEQPIQVIAPAEPVRLQQMDLADLPQTEREGQARQVIAEDVQRSFDLTHGPLLRALLLGLNEQEHILLLNLHHIIYDGWSMGVLLPELTTLYRAFCTGQPAALPELPIQYADYAIWQRQWLSGDTLAQQLAYWQQQFSGEIPTLDLPTDRPRPPIQTFHGATHSFQVAPRLTQQLLTLSHEAGATLFMTLLAAFQTLLHRYTGQTDLVIGTPIANRTRLEAEVLIGFFVNTLALRVDLQGNPSFRELVARVREVTLGAYAHQDLPFDRLVDELHVPRDLSRTPLFQVMFALQNAPLAAIELPDLRLQLLEAEGTTAKFELSLFMIETADGLSGLFEYNTDLFEPATVQRMTDHLLTLLTSLAQQPEARLSDLALLTAAEHQRLLREWNDTRLSYPIDQCLPDLFEAQVARTPEAIAVVFDEAHLTYHELNQRANRLAAYLQQHDVGPEALVGLCVERSLEMLVGLLAILKAGGAYVPLDPAYPQERLAFILADSQASLLLTQLPLLERLPQQAAQIFCLDRDWPTLAQAGVDNRPRFTCAQNLAYLIYTSGSTGRPKGVAIQHNQAVAFIHWAHQRFAPERFAGVLAATSICFDLSIFELFATLSRGGTVILAQNALHLPQLPAASRVTLLNTVPSAAKELLRSQGLPDSLRVINLAGEPLPQSLVEQLYQRPALEAVFDLYGPSETTTYSTCALRQVGGCATIGRPIGNTQIYLLDVHFQPVPVGVTGELFIGGAGVTRGYLKRPDLTAERFLPDPFTSDPGARLYRTGDLARYRSDGNLEFLGRADHQVKLRGFRIELGEIEARLTQHPALQQALVLARDEADGDKRLLAYVVPTDQQSVSASDLRLFLQHALPEYMIPAAFVTLDALPLTPNGKIDRRALPDPEGHALPSQVAYLAPRSSLEQELAAIWAAVLHLPRVGIHDNFFEAGGHSLQVVQLMARINQVWGIQLPIATLFQGATVEHLATALRQRQHATLDSSLVMMQRGEADQLPFFLVHPSGGHVLCYVDLVHTLGPQQPCYGFQARGLDDEQELDDTIEAMAHHYIQLLQTVQPEGPYQLGGWSLGGVVAFEMAQQLATQGQVVELLALVDSYAPQPEASPNDEVALLAAFAFDLGATWQTMPFDPEYLRQLAPDERLVYLFEHARQAKVIPAEVDLDRMRRLYQVFQNNISALHQYRPRPYTGPMILFTAREHFTEQAIQAETTWQPFTHGPFVVQTIPGQHYTLLRKPGVTVLAEHLKPQLRRAKPEAR
ncbi:partial arthrofactin-type cyclic lipopeptide synthetase C, partial [Thermoflexales bacterium]